MEGIEICAKCGKIAGPRDFIHGTGVFSCSRCGNKATMVVDYDDYERTVQELTGVGEHNGGKKKSGRGMPKK